MGRFCSKDGNSERTSTKEIFIVIKTLTAANPIGLIPINTKNFELSFGTSTQFALRIVFHTTLAQISLIMPKSNAEQQINENLIGNLFKRIFKSCYETD